MTKDQLTIIRLYHALKEITKYETPDKLRRSSQKQWGLDYEEALGYSYENIQQVAKNAIRGVRIPRERNLPKKNIEDAVRKVVEEGRG